MSQGLVSRVLTGKAGYGPLVVAPASVLVAVWIVMGEMRNQWDVVSLAIGLAWVAVAQISVLAHARRSGRQEASGVGSQPLPLKRDLNAKLRLCGILAACCLLLALIWAARASVVSPILLLVALGSGAVLLAAYELKTWREVGGLFPWSTVAIGCAGFAVVSLQYEAGAGIAYTMRVVAISAGTLGALCIWAGLFVRDVREIASRRNR